MPPYSAGPAESTAGLTEGEQLTVRDLLTAMMLPSANDAAETVAVGIGGTEATSSADEQGGRRPRAGTDELREPDRARRP